MSWVRCLVCGERFQGAVTSHYRDPTDAERAAPGWQDRTDRFASFVSCEGSDPERVDAGRAALAGGRATPGRTRVDAFVIAETEKAVLLLVPQKGRAWFPRAACVPAELAKGYRGNVWVPEKLLAEKGLA